MSPKNQNGRIETTAAPTDKLRASEIRYRRLFEAAQDGILILHAETGRITDVNPFLVKLLGFSRDEMLGKTVGELSPFRDIESNKVMLERLQKVGYVRYETLPLKTIDGRKIAVEFVCNVYPEGEENVIQCNIRDITERRKVEAQLTLLNVCVSKLNDVILVTESEPIDEPGPRIVFLNQAFERITGYSCASALGKSPRFLQGEKTDRLVVKEIRDALVKRLPIRRQLINYKADGTEYWMDVDIVPIFNSGKCTHFAAIERDITELKKVEESMKLFRALMDRSHDAIEIIDPQTGRFIDVNEIACRRLGYTREEMLALTINDVVDESETAFSLKGVIQNLKQVDFKIMEARHRRKDGSTFPIEVNAQYVSLDRGYLVSVVRDITERKQIEQQLQWKTAFFEAQVNSALDGILVVDSGGKKILQNRRMIELWNLPDDVAEEVDHRRRLEWITKQIKDPVQFSKKVDHLYSHPEEISRDELELANGKIFDRYTAPVRDNKGTYYGRIWTYRDITDQKRGEARFRRLVDSNAQGIIFWNKNGGITGANDAFLNLVGYTREDLTAGRVNWIAMTPQKYAEADQRCLAEVALKGVCPPYEKEYIRKDGSHVPILLGAAGFEDSPDEGVCFTVDLTERKKLEQQFLRAQRMESIGTLAGGIAHDLNNILAPIMMSIDILKTMFEKPQALSILDTIEVSAKRGADIVRQVLSFSRGLEGERIEVQPQHLLHDIESIVKNTFPKNIRLEFSVPKDTWPILGDPTQVHQVLLNLCVNARDAMPNGGNLTIAVANFVLDENYAAMNLQAKAGRYVTINVIDSGTGIPKDVIDKIFDPFFTTKDIGKGTGLGLSTVMAIVKSHAGAVNVYSEAGKGTNFNVYFPAMETSTEARQEQAELAALPRGNGETILVIDDEDSIRTITKQTLQAFGYRVLTAIDGADGVAMYAQHRHEVAAVVTDMMMPVMDGAATIHALLRINPAAKIIAVSGLNSNGTVTTIFETSVKHFLTKPYTAAALLQVMRKLLDKT